jgi:uncharacterized protein (TIGR02996 family)
MKKEEMEQAFLNVIEKHPRDKDTRLVYGDWLEENDRIEEADFVRAWTEKKYYEAIEWIKKFKDDVNKEDGGGDYDSETTMEDIIQAGWNHVKHGSVCSLVGSGFWADEQIADDEFRNAFWTHWSVITGKAFLPKGESHTRDGYLFSCCN